MGIAPRGFQHDVMLYAFLLSADPSGCACEVLAEKYLDRKLGTSPEQRADCALDLHASSARRSRARSAQDLRRASICRCPACWRMERTGVRIEPAQLAVLSERMDAEIQRLSAEIYEIAGAPFNISSPQQLAKVLL